MVVNTVRLIHPTKPSPESLSHWTEYGGSRLILMGDAELPPELATVAQRVNHPQALALLYPLASLMQGCWRIESETRTRLSLDIVERECNLDDNHMFVLFHGSAHVIPATQVFAATAKWPAWDFILQKIRRFTEPRDFRPLPVFFQDLLLKYPQLFTWGPTIRYSLLTADPTQRVFNPGSNCNPLPATTRRLTEAEASIVQEGVSRLRLSAETGRRYVRAILRWGAKGFPRRTKEEVQHIFREHCLPCDQRVRGKCKLCHCRINEYTITLLNKIRMGTEHCPRKPSPW